MSEQKSDHDRYVVVARRYRPKTFDELVGQPHISQALGNAIETGRVGHAYLFTGARGTGKTSTARIFAKCLNAPGGPTIRPDLQSDIAQSIDAGEDMDVIEIDGASNRGIDEIRQLRSTISVRPSRSRFKIYIIDEVHMLTTGAFNALLKTLEEPPEHVKFIFCTTDPEKLPITVLSRCQRFDFVPVGMDDIMGRLQEIVAKEHATATDDALRLLARRAAGSMRDSQSLLEQVLSFSGGEITVDKIHAVLGSADESHLHALLDLLCQRNAAGALAALDEALFRGVDAGQLAEQLLGYFRDLMIATVGGGAELLRYAMPADYENLLAHGRGLGLQSALAIVQLLDQAVARMRQSIHSRILLEAAIVQICYLPDLEAVSAVAAAIAQKAGKPTSAPPLPRPSPAAPAPVATTSQGAEKKNAERTPVPVTKPPTAETVRSPSRSPAETPAAKPIERPPVARTDAVHAPSTRPAGLVTIWKEAIAKWDDLTADYVRSAAEVTSLGEGRLRIAFAANQQLNRAACEKADRRAKLERVVSDAAGYRVQLEFVTLPGQVAAAPPPAPVPASVSRVHRMRAVEQDPFMQQLMEIFDVEILRVDEPKSAS